MYARWLLGSVLLFVSTAPVACGVSTEGAGTAAGDASGDDASGAEASAEGGAWTESGAPSSGDAAADAGGPGADAHPSPPCTPSWSVTAACGGSTGSSAAPDFGPNVIVFDPSMSTGTMQQKLDDIYGQQDAAQFGSGRYAFFFRPGAYALDVKVGFYTQVVGLGQGPDDVAITGAVRAKADWLGNQNATCNFWRGAENLSVTPTQAIDGNVDVWAVSQGTHLRRVHVAGDVHLDDGGWSSGGFIADSLVDGQLVSGSQQQFITRNDDQSWTGGNWNMVFVGDGTAPSPSWPNPPYTIAATTPIVREKPFLYLDPSGHYAVMVPSLKKGSAGHSWAGGAPPGLPQSIDRFYVAKPAVDTAASMNAALAAGKHLLLTPGIYHLQASLQVSRPGTIVMGLGLATLIPDQGTAIVSVADVDDVTLAGLLLEAGPTSSSTLLEIGPTGSSASHATAPTAVFDVHCRVGGADPGTTSRCVTLNSHDVIVDNTWLWRADHGAGASWTGNVAANGLVVNGDDVTIYGLFVEHFQQYQTLWNGNGGSVFFYQSEMPYDPPDQASWQESPGHDGYPSYKVADGVTTHHAQGLGVYSVFTNDVTAEDGLETPSTSGVSMQHMVTVSLASGSITHIIDDTGGSVGNGTMTSYSSQ